MTNGYLLIDHRASPGTLDVPEGKYTEFNTFTCCHCNGVVVMNPSRVRARNTCWKCSHLTCDKGVCVTECNPIKEGLDLIIKYPNSNQPFILRGPNGEILFNKNFRENIY